MYNKPIELRIQKHLNGGFTFYTVKKVFEGIGNTADVGHKFMTNKDCIDWCNREYAGVPRIYETPIN